MSKTTVIALAGKRLEVRDSPTSPGHILIQIVTADRAVQASLTLRPDAAVVLGDALGIAAARVELHADLVQQTRAQGEGAKHALPRSTGNESSGPFLGVPAFVRG